MTVKASNDLERQTRLLSPRIAALSRSIRQGDAAALARFWQQVGKQGTPLIEPLEESRTFSLLTFLWQASRPAREILLLSSLSEAEAGDRLIHLRGSDLWYKSYRVRNDLRATYHFQVDGMPQADPLNRQFTHIPGDGVSPYGETRCLSIVRMPEAQPLPWVTPVPGRPFGRVNQHALHSAQLGNIYRVWVYTPPNYTRAAEPYRLLLLLDGWMYVRVLHTSAILDNLLDVGALPPLVTVMLGHSDRETRGREFAFYLPFLDFVSQELLPWIRQHYYVAGDPARTIVGGVGLSAVTATLLGLRHPDLFGNVLAQSGHFAEKLPGDVEHERLANLIATNPAVPVRFHLDVGLLETHPTPDGGPSVLVSNRHLRHLLQARGYRVHYEEFSGGSDPLCWQETLVDGLLALLKGFGPG